MTVVRLDDYRAARGERGCGVAAGYRKCEWKIAGTEYHHWSQCSKHRTHVGFRRRFAVRISMVNPRVQPPAVFDQRREHSQLSAGARGLALQSGEGQGGFLVG